MTAHPHSTPSHPAPHLSGEGEDVIRYAAYMVYTKTQCHGAKAPVDTAELTASLEKFIADQEQRGVVVRGLYDVSDFRADGDIMTWMHAENPAALQQAGRDFRALMPGRLSRTWAAMGVHRQAEFSKDHAPAFLDDRRTPKEWITVYPFVRSYDWYLLPEDERREMLREHGMLGRDFPQVHANTVAAFALGDYEWLLSFEADHLHELVDMMRHLRYSKARLHVRDELPFYAGRRVTPATAADLMN
ncbi:hydrogen peroxide-dependent heme synthase [Devriesea agamarum]|uniref:hydrogen peroxide-dependent heme synthase n=1 Tax=Devriesea agamarum TaxID=472569 RepID=UPI000A032709|nr:hydrogen peroxide-dependent heme synthase [Devriesea agamarum]